MFNAFETNVYIIEISKLHRYYHQFAEFLSHDELQKSELFYNEDDKKRYIMSHGSIRIILGESLNVAPKNINFQYNPYGKPEVHGNQHIYFNSSHTKNYCAISVSKQYELGIDIEEKRLKELEIYPLVSMLHENEQKYLLKNKDDIIHNFYKLWTAKEALLKAYGIGLSTGLHTSYIIPEQYAFNSYIKEFGKYKKSKSTIMSFSFEDSIVALCVRKK